MRVPTNAFNLFNVLTIRAAATQMAVNAFFASNITFTRTTALAISLTAPLLLPIDASAGTILFDESGGSIGAATLTGIPASRVLFNSCSTGALEKCFIVKSCG